MSTLPPTMADSNEDKPIDDSRQQIVFCLAIRGEGKSYLIEALAVKQYYKGYMILDLHAPPNLENAYYCIPLLESEEEILDFKRNPRKYTRNRRAIPVTLVGSETMQWDPLKVEMYNDRRVTYEEWIESGKPLMDYPNGNPPMKPEHQWGRELIRIEKIPFTTAKPDTEQNQKATAVLFRVLLECRKQGRIFVLNRKLFPTEKQYFWTMALILRIIEQFSDLHMVKKFPSEVGVENREQMKPVDRNWHKGVLVTREIADLAPARTKADVSGESTQVKKATMGLARIIRHIEFDWYGDWQKFTDVVDSVRSQADTWLFKKWSRDLAGEKESIFDQIEFIRKAILFKGRGKKKAIRKANRYFPPINNLSKFWYYCRFISGKMKLFPVPKINHMHKEPDMKFHDMTGVLITHDMSKVTKEKGSGQVLTPDNELKLLYHEMKSLKEKKKKWAEIIPLLETMKKDGKIVCHHNFQGMSSGTISKIYSRLNEKFSKEDEIIAK